MSGLRISRRVLGIEFLRGVAPIAAASLLVTGLYMLFSQPSDWAGRWNSLAELLSARFAALGPLAAAAGAWQAGRERRRRIGELIRSTARPAWQQLVVVWSATTLGTAIGFCSAYAVGAAMVAPTASYFGHGWGWLLVVTLMGLGAATAIGIAAGRIFSSRVIPPIVAVVLLVVLSGLTAADGGGLWLTPAHPSVDGYHFVEASVRAWQLVWLSGVVLTALVLAGARRRVLALLPLAIAVAGFSLLAGGPGIARLRQDKAATERVCTNPPYEVCLPRVDSYLLDDITRPARASLARWRGVPGGPVRISNQAQDYLEDDTLVLGYVQQDVLGRPTNTDYLVDGTAEFIASLAHRCDEEGKGPDDIRLRLGLEEIALRWSLEPLRRSGLVDESRLGGKHFGSHSDRFNRLLALPEPSQKAWMARYLDSARNCDAAGLADLWKELT